MPWLVQTLHQSFEPLGIALVGGSVACLTWFAYEAGLRDFLAGVKDQSVRDGAGSAFQTAERLILRRLGRLSLPLISEKNSASLRRKMIMSGLDMRDTVIRKPEEFVALQEISAVCFGLAVWWVCSHFDWNPVYAVAGLAFGAIFPRIWLRDQVIRRHLLITRALPYNLDLLTLSVEAGLDFTGALNKVVERGRKGPLLDELALVLRQLKMGKTRAESLKIMVDRVNLPPLTTFVSALIQADKMGTPLGRILRIQSQQLRVDRTQRAEKLANEAPVKMLGPLIFCIFPTVFLIIFGPIAFQFVSGQFVSGP